MPRRPWPSRPNPARRGLALAGTDPPPDVFAVVMATGVTSMAAGAHGYRSIAVGLGALAIGVFGLRPPLGVAVDSGSRCGLANVHLRRRGHGPGDTLAIRVLAARGVGRDGRRWGLM